jgi:hypothetical protein
MTYPDDPPSVSAERVQGSGGWYQRDANTCDRQLLHKLLLPNLYPWGRHVPGFSESVADEPA